MDLLDIDTKESTKENGQDRVESLNHAAAQSYGRLQAALEQNHIHGLAAPSEGDGGSRAKTETLCPSRPRGEREGEESEREETESSDDNTTQYSIHPPHDCPYLLLLQGCSPAQVSTHTPSAAGPERPPSSHGSEVPPDVFIYSQFVFSREDSRERDQQ